MKNKNYIKYIYQDALIILITLIVSIICEIWIFKTTSNYDYSVLMILYLIVILGQKKQKKVIGIIMIIASVLMIIESIIDFSSVFNLIFLLFGIFSIYHSICYLTSFRKLSK